ncbi:MAG: hypothetical protein M3P48_09895 [Actinomycetota bacterium]|nr:hypothetical protein [Actinomycetota bacterium]
MSAGSLLAAYRFPEVARSAHAELTADALLDGSATLYLVAAERHQRLLTPLVVSILSAVLHDAAERANAGSPLRPTLECSSTRPRTSRRFATSRSRRVMVREPLSPSPQRLGNSSADRRTHPVAVQPSTARTGTTKIVSSDHAPPRTRACQPLAPRKPLGDLLK